MSGHGPRSRRRRARKDKEAQNVRFLYSGLWVRYREYGSDFVSSEYEQLKTKLKTYGLVIPNTPDKDLYRFSVIVLSAKEGSPVAIGYDTLLELANYVFDRCKPLLWYFGKTISHFGHWQKLMQEDNKVVQNKRRQGRKHISWVEKRRMIRKGLAKKDPEFEQNRNYDKLYYFLFPEIRNAVSEGDSDDARTSPR